MVTLRLIRMRMRSTKLLVALAVTCILLPARISAAGDAPDARWWPVQARPAGLVCTGSSRPFPEPQAAYHMLAQSVAGLAAKAVNERRGDEMVWVGTGNADVEAWYAAVIGRKDPEP